MPRLEFGGAEWEVWVDCDEKRLEEHNLKHPEGRSSEQECWVASQEDKVCRS